MLDSKTLAEKLRAAHQNGDLSRAMKKHELHTLLVFTLRYNPRNGLRRWGLIGSHYHSLAAVYKDLGLGELNKYMRDYRHYVTKDFYTLTSPREGRSILDADLLGGDGSGEVFKAFQEAGLRIS